MFKNFIIIWLGFIVFSLMVQKPENIDLLVKDTVEAKEMVKKGFTYAKNSYEILTNPKAYVDSLEPVESVKPELKSEPMEKNIQQRHFQEETWFNEK